MTTPESGKSEGFVGFSIFVRADANKRRFEKPDHGRHDLVAGESGELNIGLHALADLPQHVTELKHPLEFRSVAVLPKLRMIAVLLAAARVPRRHLQVSVFVGTDPDLRPCRWNNQRAEPLQ